MNVSEQSHLFKELQIYVNSTVIVIKLDGMDWLWSISMVTFKLSMSMIYLN